MLPTFLAFTVTLGVAALAVCASACSAIFCTASSILIGALWLVVIPLVMVAYYGFYYFSYTAEKQGRESRDACWDFRLAVLLGIAFIFVNNMTLGAEPRALAGDVSCASGRMEPESRRPLRGCRAICTLSMDRLHCSAAILAHLGMRKMKVDAEYGRWMVQRSALVFATCTGLQFLLGMWLLLAIPREIAMGSVDGSAGGIVFGLALISVIAAMLLILLGSLAEKPRSDGPRGIWNVAGHALPDGLPALSAAVGLLKSVSESGNARGAPADPE